MRALIVDDEAPARAHLRTLLEEMDGVELVGEAANAMEAEKLLRAMEHDVVFLDIRMPGLDGVEAAELFEELPKSPLVIFTTAYEEYAAKAFELGAADYLLKPISRSRLEKALLRAWERRGRREGGPGEAGRAPQAKEGRTLQYVTARRGHKMILVAVEDIAFINVEGEIVHVFTENDSYVALAPSLDQLEKGLAGADFFRTHRSYLVNLTYVAEVVPMFNRTYELVMKDARRSRVPVSRRKAVELRELLGF
jgi:DNA-binding LytR/AlgR family response regulator